MKLVESRSGRASWRVRRLDDAPVVAIRVWLRGGSRLESIPGLAQISGRLLPEGTELRDRRRIILDAADRGCTVLAGAGRSVQAIALDGLAGDWRRLLDWAAELLWLASFHEDRCRWLRAQAAAELRSLEDLPEVVTGRTFLGQLFPGHPLGRPLLGTAEGLAAIDETDCRLYHRQCLDEEVLVAVAGEVDPDAVVVRLETLFRDLSGPQREPRAAPALTAPGERVRSVRLSASRQAHLFVGARTVCRSAPDVDALRVLGVVLGEGAGLVGRLPARVREKEGLAYDCSVATIAGAGVDPGYFVVSLATSPDTIGRAREAVLEEVERVRQEGASAKEVDDSCSYLLGRAPFDRETVRQWAQIDLESMLWGLPLDDEWWCRRRIEEVTVEAVREVAGRYLDPHRLVETVGSPGGRASPSPGRRGIVNR
jgi:zinc protease